MSYNLESEVTNALRELLKTELGYDVIVNVGKEELCFKEFHVHSNFLRCRSDYFNKVFSADDVERADGKFVINKPNITPQAFSVIIKYLYTGRINITRKTGAEILDIMIASNDLELNQLTKLAEGFLLKNHERHLRADSVKILQITYDHQVFKDIRGFCLEMTCFEPEILFNSAEFINLPDNLLEVILKRDDLNLVEIEIWENLIKWGSAQQDDLETILHRFIPLIRFHSISSSDYINKVIKDYENTLPKELKDDIYRSHMVPGYTPTLNVYKPRYSPCIDVNSIIIKQKHVALFASWIDKRKENSEYIKTVPYQFKRILRGIISGFDPDTFHRVCDNQGANIVVIKIKDSNQIIGGYNPLDWNGKGSNENGWKCTKDSFIFSFKDYRDIKTGQIGRVINKNYAIKHDLTRGPVFGIELVISNNDGFSSFQRYYPEIGIPTKFEIENYEVFQVKRKPTNHSTKGCTIL